MLLLHCFAYCGSKCQGVTWQASVTKALFAIRDVKVPTRRSAANNVMGKRKRSRK